MFRASIHDRTVSFFYRCVGSGILSFHNYVASAIFSQKIKISFYYILE